MGLDVFVYKNLKEFDASDSDDYITFYETFEDRIHPLKEYLPYDGDYMYDVNISMSYGSYNKWRDDLAKLAGYESAEYVWNNVIHGPFYELINFSDCEGTIGSIVSKKLAEDFSEFQNKADESLDDRFKYIYNEFRKAFEYASEDGAVKFG